MNTLDRIYSTLLLKECLNKVTPSDIQRSTGVTFPTIKKRLTFLISKSYVVELPHKNKQTRIFYITKTGRTFLKELEDLLK